MVVRRKKVMRKGRGPSGGGPSGGARKRNVVPIMLYHTPGNFFASGATGGRKMRPTVMTQFIAANTERPSFLAKTPTEPILRTKVFRTSRSSRVRKNGGKITKNDLIQGAKKVGNFAIKAAPYVVKAAKVLAPLFLAAGQKRRVIRHHRARGLGGELYIGENPAAPILVTRGGRKRRGGCGPMVPQSYIGTAMAATANIVRPATIRGMRPVFRGIRPSRIRPIGGKNSKGLLASLLSGLDANVSVK